MKGTAVQIGIILLVTITIFFTNLGTPRLWDRDEPRNAGCAAEMMARNDWVVPIFNSQLRPHKPALLYWLMMSAYSVFGVNEFSARFWSAVLAVGTCLATYLIGRRLFDSVIGFVGAIALATSMMFVVAARAATPDSVLVFCGTVSLMFFVLGAFPKQNKQTNEAGLAKNGDDGQWRGFFPTNNLYVWAAYITMGLGVLAKGPIGFLLPMAMIGMFGLWKTLPKRQAHDDQTASWLASIKLFFLHFIRCFHPVHFGKTLWTMRPVTAAAIILAISLPWFILAHIRTEGDFTQLFFVGEHFVRATKAMENHSGGVLFYPLMILIGFFPWSCFWGPAVIGLFKPVARSPQGNRWRTATLFLCCWVGVQVGAFTIAKTKLPSYVTPCYPALALLAASCLVDFARQLKPNRAANPDGFPQPRVAGLWFYAAFAGLGIGGVLITAGVWVGVGEYLPSVRWLAVLGLIPVVASGWLLWELRSQRSSRIIAIYCVSAVVLAIAAFDFGVLAIDSQRSCMTVLNEVKQRSGPVATYGPHESTWVFYCQKPIVELHEETGPVQTFASGPVKNKQPRKFWKQVPWQRLNSFVANNEDPLIITSSDKADDLLERLPDDFGLICDADYFVAKSDEGKKLCLIGRVVDKR